MKNKGFTLLEVLGIIVIIGVIALITIPRINNAITFSEKGSAKTGAINYIKAIDNYYVNKKMNEDPITLNGVYNVDNKGRLSNNSDIFEIEFTGGVLTNGTLTYLNNDFRTGCLTINGYKVNIDSNRNVTTEKGDCQAANNEQ